MIATSVDAVPPAPREPSAAAWRAQFAIWAKGGVGGQLVVALLATAIAVFVGWGTPVDLAIANAPVRQRAELLSTRENTHISEGGHGRGSSRHPHILRFAYVVDGQRFEGESHTYGRLPSADPADGTIEIERCAWRPGWARAVGTEVSYFPPGMLLFSLAPLAALIGAGFALRARNIQLRTFRTGEPILAEIYKHGRLRTGRRTGPMWIAFWRYPLEGQTYRGSFSSNDESLIREMAAAKQLVVLCDPARPRRSVAYLE